MNKIVLVGNPNTGKTTLFNSIAKTNEHVGNWHGVTVEAKEKTLKHLSGKDFVLVDVPGTYSLTSFSFEEQVTRDYIFANKNATFVNICDANNLERNLFLTLELLEFGIKPILCINMANELEKNQKKIDTKKLEDFLKIKVFLIDAQKPSEASKIVDFALLEQKSEQKANLTYCKLFESQIDKILLSQNLPNNLTSYEKMKICECDDFFVEKVAKTQEKKQNLLKILNQKNTLQNLIESRYNFINQIVTGSIKTEKNHTYGYSKLDKIFLNKFLVLPMFLIILAFIFVLTFGQFGSFLSEKIYQFFDEFLFGGIKNFIISKTDNLFVQNFLCQAVFGTISSLFSFLPQIAIMFLGLYILEDSGYMSRLAFCFDDIFNLVGLSGKSIFTLLMGLGCATTATLTSRDMDDKNSKIKTAMLTPYISCTAKLPIYALITSAFFPKIKFLIVFCFYLLGIIIAILMSYFLNKTFFKSKAQSFIMELPPYRFPNAKKLSKKIVNNILEFVLRVGSILLGFSCIVWILQNCNFKLQYNTGESILLTLSKFISPIFAPLGFANSGAVACLLCGFVAKEIIVSTIAIVNNVGMSKNFDDISKSITLSSSVFFLTRQSALSFLVFATLYLPCLSTVSVLSKEIGKKLTLFACVLEFLTTYLLSFVVYKISSYFAIKGTLAGIMSLFVTIFVIFAIILSVRIIKRKKYCKFCPKQNFCNNK